MKLKNKFILFSVIIHLVFIFLLLNLPGKTYIFILGELLILFSFILSIWLYRGISQPSKLISAGIEAIKDQDFNTRLAKTGHSEMDKLIGIYNQMIDQLREERIKQSEKHHTLDKLIQASPSGIVMLDENNRISSINKAAVGMLDAKAADLKGFMLQDIAGQLAGEIGKLENGKAEVINLNGSTVYKCQKAHFVDLGYSHYFIMIETLNDEIYKKEKNAYDKVIRIMSHETNNSIGAINSILSTIINFKDQLLLENREDYENALNVAINRNKALSNIMSNFAQVLKIPEPVKESTDLHALLRTVKMLMNSASRKKGIIWEWQLCTEDHFVFMDVQQIEQVVINIIKNSIEAVKNKGKVIIRTTSSPLSVSILDNGCGLSKEVNKQIFSPFFSTKKNGQGVGLTVVREILIKHNFVFSLESKDGWTEFYIRFK
jgi:two-component system nitrogen regulation sensor histidine kinase NtrY